MNADRKTLSVCDSKISGYVKLAVGDDFSNRHTRKAAFPQHLETLHKALKPDDLFHIGMKLGTGEARDRIGRFYAYYGEEELMDLLQAAGFRPEFGERGSGKGLDGTDAPWIVVRARA